jgi:predicted transcriptional regulator
MDILYRRGRATATEVQGDLPGGPHSSTVRTQLRVLERKGFVLHHESGLRYVYKPAIPRRSARRFALSHLVDTFFDNSVDEVIRALLVGRGATVTERTLADIAARAAKTRKQAR